MTGKIGDTQRLSHIMDAISEIETYTRYAESKDFLENSMMRFASIKQLEIIGEAANYLSLDIKQQISSINWKQIVGMRHILIHEYFGIDGNLVWQVITKDLPVLKEAILSSLKKLN